MSEEKIPRAVAICSSSIFFCHQILSYSWSCFLEFTHQISYFVMSCPGSCHVLSHCFRFNGTNHRFFSPKAHSAPPSPAHRQGPAWSSERFRQGPGPWVLPLQKYGCFFVGYDMIWYKNPDMIWYDSGCYSNVLFVISWFKWCFRFFNIFLWMTTWMDDYICHHPDQTMDISGQNHFTRNDEWRIKSRSKTCSPAISTNVTNRYWSLRHQPMMNFSATNAAGKD